MNKLSQCIDKIYDERKKFIIIGLTGRTGSGCSVTAELLTKDFDGLNPSIPVHEKTPIKEDRSYQIVYDYTKNMWEPFKIIKVSSIICTFILEYDYSTFIKTISDIDESKISFDKNKCKIDLETIKDSFDHLHEDRLRIKQLIEDNNDSLGFDEVYTFFFEDIYSFHKQIRPILEKCNKRLYTFLWQLYGDNIRASGSYNNSELIPEYMFRLSQRINTYIKILRKRSQKTSENVRVVIDAFRNPFEVTFFKDRYSSFYLFAITAQEEKRFSRLITMSFDADEIMKIDKKEYPKKGNNEEYFSSQDIQRCIELADIYVHNDESKTNLAAQLIRYIALIVHPGLICPTKEERCMQIAYNAKVNSGCISRQVGAVVTDVNYSILSIGWNDTPQGQVPCNLRSVNDLINDRDTKAFSEYEKGDEFKSHIRKLLTDKITKIQDTHISFCFKDAYNNLKNKDNQVHTRALHAEENAFLQLIKHGGVLLQSGNLFTTASPCELCSKKAYQLGIKNIYFIDPYPGISESHILHSGEIIPNLIYFQGAIGRAYTSLFQNSLPYKDETELKYGFSLKKI